MVTDEGRRSEVTNKVEMTTGKKKMLDFLEAHILTSLAMLSIFCKIGENSIYFMRSLWRLKVIYFRDSQNYYSITDW